MKERVICWVCFNHQYLIGYQCDVSDGFPFCFPCWVFPFSFLLSFCVIYMRGTLLFLQCMFIIPPPFLLIRALSIRTVLGAIVVVRNGTERDMGTRSSSTVNSRENVR